MSDNENEYPKDPRSTVNRLKDRGVYDYATIHKIVQTSPVLHVSFVPSLNDPFPTILPMIGIMGSFTSPNTPLDLTSRPLDLYLHGHSSSRFMRQSADPVDNEGIPICVCATHVDGLVLALSPFNHSMNYRSAVIHGYANVVTEDAEKIYAMTLITDKLIPDRWVNSRNPPFKSEMQSTAILKVTVVSASAKVRVGGPSDDRKDEANREVRGKIWTGVVPMHTILGEPVPSETNEVPLPADLKNRIEKVNEDGKKYAFGATSKVAGK